MDRKREVDGKTATDRLIQMRERQMCIEGDGKTYMEVMERRAERWVKRLIERNELHG